MCMILSQGSSTTTSSSDAKKSAKIMGRYLKGNQKKIKMRQKLNQLLTVRLKNQTYVMRAESVTPRIRWGGCQGFGITRVNVFAVIRISSLWASVRLLLERDGKVLVRFAVVVEFAGSLVGLRARLRIEHSGVGPFSAAP